MTRYVLTFAALVALTVLTLLLSFVHLGPWSLVLALAIAVAKSALIALVFMHLVEHRVASRLAVGVAVALAVLLVAFTLVDVRSRDVEGPTPALSAAAAAR